MKFSRLSAFLYFAEQKVDIAVLEVGMGGRLDATNVVDPLLSIVTDISLDHMEWLGSTISAIAGEKAGILRRGGTMITLPQHPEANQVLGEIATELGRARRQCRSLYARAGTHTALTGSRPSEPPSKSIHRSPEPTSSATSPSPSPPPRNSPQTTVSPSRRPLSKRASAAPQWPGRLERFTEGPVEWILDVAHNPAGAWALRAGLHSILELRAPRVLIFSCLRDKPVAEMAQILFPLFDRVIVAPIHTARAAAVEDLLAAAKATGTAAVAA